jgi:hypothetical protein
MSKLQEQKDKLLRTLSLTREDLFVQRGDADKYAPSEDKDEILAEIDRHIDLLDESEAIIQEWSTKLNKVPFSDYGIG